MEQVAYCYLALGMERKFYLYLKRAANLFSNIDQPDYERFCPEILSLKN